MGKKESEEDRIVRAYHEAGHVVASWFLEHGDPLFMASIIPIVISKDTGCAPCLEIEILHLYTKEQLFDRMSSQLGGAVAEQIFFGKIQLGFEADLKMALGIAYIQVGDIDETGILSFHFPLPENDEVNELDDDGYESCDYDEFDEFYYEVIFEDIKSKATDLFEKSYGRTLKLLTEHKEDVEKVALRLLDKGVLARDDVRELLGPRPFKAKSITEQHLDGIICSTFLSTFVGLRSWIEKFKQEYRLNFPLEIGMSNQPDGYEFYAEELSRYLADLTSVTPEQFHAKGLAEVKRFVSEMEKEYLPNADPEIDVSESHETYYVIDLRDAMGEEVQPIDMEKTLKDISMLENVAPSTFQKFLSNLRGYSYWFLWFMKQHKKYVVAQPLISLAVLLRSTTKILSPY